MAQYVHTMEASFVATDEPNKVMINHACEVISSKVKNSVILWFINDLFYYNKLILLVFVFLKVAKAVFWLRSFCKYMGISENVVELCIAPSIIALLQF